MNNEKTGAFLEAFYKKRTGRSRPTIKDQKSEESTDDALRSQRIFDEKVRENIRKIQERTDWTRRFSNVNDADLEKMYPHSGEPAKFYTQIPKNNIQETENGYSFVVHDFNTNTVSESLTIPDCYREDHISLPKSTKPRYNKVADRAENEKSDFYSGIENMKRDSEKESTEIRYKPVSGEDYKAFKSQTIFKSLNIPDPMVDICLNHISFEGDEEGQDPYIE